jgi:guanylate kinase
VSSAGNLFVLSSPSGGGKTTVIRELMARNPALACSISATTRQPRIGETDGVHYHFLADDEFDRLMGKGAFLEWATVHGSRYGTLGPPVEACLAAGGTMLLALDVQGGWSVKQTIPEAVLVFLLPPSMDVLRERLQRRGTENAEALADRIRNAEQEIRAAGRYDYQIINDRLDDTVAEIENVIHHQQQKKRTV